MNRKSLVTAYLLWTVGLFGLLGLHRLYLGRIGSGILWMLSLGVFGVGAFVDLFLLPEMVRSCHQQAEIDVLRTTAMAQLAGASRPSQIGQNGPAA